MDATTPLAARQARPRILLVEDDDGVRRSLHLLLHGSGYEVRSYAAAGPLLADPTANNAWGLIADYLLPDCDGLDVLRALQDGGWAGKSVLITGHLSPELRKAATDAGFGAILEKPLRRHDLMGALS
ncbi:response regulator [Sphingomonas canadensis]|uniref:Response regulator n=1 Tax=Sphingomonas canadensis TaxID=1219257 RepID=A0ABW3HBM9_9SPHN|nr:response regulator [Sphingomonas canadensis]MCW3836515.1 response regulator [Sphingomonas canadensis]